MNTVTPIDVLLYLSVEPELTRFELATALGISPQYAGELLLILMFAGLVEDLGPLGCRPSAHGLSLTKPWGAP